ncbi:MAG: FkbM family methyltransferase [Acidimicrobiales bacterium]
MRAERRRARFLAARLVWRSGAWRWLRLPIRFEEGFRTYLQPTSLSARYWISRDHAKEDRDFLRSCLKQGDVVVDVGANIGILALTAATLVGRSGRVVAIEPNERVFSFLRENVRLNRMGHVECLRCAIGSSTTMLAMTDVRSDDFNAVVPGNPLRAVAAQMVRCRTLDDVIPPDEDVALLKIDVEGFELPVLRGATAVLSRTARVYFECYQRKRHCDRYGYEPRDLIDFLEDHGFFALPLAGRDDRPRPLTRLGGEVLREPRCRSTGRRQGRDPTEHSASAVVTPGGPDTPRAE